MPEAVAATPIGTALARAAATLAEAGCTTPRLDAELLLAWVLDADRARLVIDSRSPLAPADLERFETVLARRAAREPVAYIVGSRDFRHISLAVDRRALIPRPETELLVEVGLTLAPGLRVLDVGTGSGAVALALKAERPDLSIRGSDLSAEAVALARENAARLGLEVEFLQADLLDGIRCDVVLANLPYVAESSAPLAPEIMLYEPAGALFAGEDGLDVIRRLIAALDGVSAVALEVGFDQAEAVASLLEAAGFGSVQRVPDLAGHQRVVLAHR